MAETARKRFDISEKSSTKRRVGKTDFRTDCTKRALNVVRIDKQNTGLIHVTNLFPYFLIPLFPLSERRLTHQFGTEWQNYINLILLKDNDKWRRNNITFVTNLFPYSPVLDLLHAHGDSPEERCSSRLVPFAIRTRFAVLLAGVKRVCNAAAFASPFRPLPARAPSVRKSAIPLFPLPKWQYAQNPCPIRLSAGGGGG